MRKYIYILILTILCLSSCNNKKTAGQMNDNTQGSGVNVEDVSDDSSLYLLVGTYTVGDSRGIYVYQFDTISGNSRFAGMVDVDNPSYLTVSKNEQYVYSVTEKGDNTAAVNAFLFDKTKGELKLLNTQLAGGADPCYITIDQSGKHVITANYSGGNISLFNTNVDGTLSVIANNISFMGKGADAKRQAAPHLHCVQFSPDEKYLFAVDLGTDKIHKFEVNENDTVGNYLKLGNPPATSLKSGSGPRHLEFHPNGKYAYLINELSGAVTAFDYDAKNGNLSEIQSILADTLNAQGSADIHVSPDGKYLYASNRLKGDGLAIFSINEADGKLTKIGYQETGVHPRNFIITPNGKFLLLASRDDDKIQVFAINKETGMLENAFKDIELDMPVCLKFISLK